MTILRCICNTWHLQYVASAIRGICNTWHLQYVASAAFAIRGIRCICKYVASAIRGIRCICNTWHLQYVASAASAIRGICNTWHLLYLQYVASAIRGKGRVQSLQMARVGQDRLYAPYMTVYLMTSLPRTPYVHRIWLYMDLANPTDGTTSHHGSAICLMTTSERPNSHQVINGR